MNNQEIWKPVPGYESIYEVSDHGRVRSVARVDSRSIPRGGFVMTPSVNCRSGYLDIGLSKLGNRRRFKIHVLVATAFHGPKPDPEADCRHLDGDKLNNCATNLAWGSRKQNAADRSAHGTTASGERNGGGGKLTAAEVVEIKGQLADGASCAKLARDFGVTPGMIRHIKKERAWRTNEISNR